MIALIELKKVTHKWCLSTLLSFASTYQNQRILIFIVVVMMFLLQICY